jgi:putative hydrolase of the HAD superfamily
MRGYLIWDFDGTLGYRPGQWSGTMVQVLRRSAGLEIDIERVRPFMRKGFPWHTPGRSNPPMRAANDWWDAMLPVFEEAFAACDVPEEQARSLAAEVRSAYTDLAEWRLFDDTREVLTEHREDGWKHAILSNHVPELPLLVEGLGLGSLVGRIVNSAETGFEKPHPRAFQAALAALEDPAEVWMIGDNVEADVVGAEAVGIRAILVRREDGRAKRCAQSLWEVKGFLG